MACPRITHRAIQLILAVIAPGDPLLGCKHGTQTCEPLGDRHYPPGRRDVSDQGVITLYSDGSPWAGYPVKDFTRVAGKFGNTNCFQLFPRELRTTTHYSQRAGLNPG